MAAKDLTAIGLEILQTARNELYLNLPYLDVALCSLDFQPGGGVTLSLATDGETLYYDGSFLSERYLRSRTAVDRAYLHVLLHCMLRHLWKKRGRVAELWDLACRCRGGEHPGRAGLPLPGRGLRPRQAEVLRRVPGRDAGADGGGHLPPSPAAGPAGVRGGPAPADLSGGRPWPVGPGPAGPGAAEAAGAEVAGRLRKDPDGTGDRAGRPRPPAARRCWSRSRWQTGTTWTTGPSSGGSPCPGR